MDALRSAAREYLKRADRDGSPDFSTGEIAVADGLNTLSRDISSHKSSNHHETCENLLVAQAYLRSWGSRPLSETDVEAANNLYAWVIGISLPSSEFADALDVAYSADKEKQKPLTDSLRDIRFRLSLGVSVLRCLSTVLPIEDASNAPDIITTLASFTSEKDPWTTKWAHEQALQALESYVSRTRSDNAALWPILEDILKSRIKPLFAKTKNPAITAAGRKNLHPIPSLRFDSSLLDPETKPWKFHDVYATTVFAWVLSNFLPSDTSHVEALFPLLVPPILSLIDDENISFKTRGCNLLSTLLIPLRDGKSDILKRTNLSSVFEDAITPCLLSLPTITPEDESIQLLGAAYPALLSVLNTRYQNASASPDRSSNRTLSREEDKQAHLRGVTQMLRISLIPSFHHISSNTPTATSSIASFPYPRLSTLLLEQMCILLDELRIHATKYLQDIVPLLYATLTNPFGTAYLPLLLAAVAATRGLILNTHPRVWRWRGELLGGLCECWLHVLEEEKQIAEAGDRKSDSFQKTDPEVTSEIVKLKNQLKGCVYLLKVVLISVTQQNKVDGGLEGNWLGLDTGIDVDQEFGELVSADGNLRGLLFAEISAEEVDDLY